MSGVEIYKELARETNELRNDLTRHSHAAKFAASANKAAIEELKVKQVRLEERIRELERREAVNADRIEELRVAKKEHTGKIATLTVNDARDIASTEKTKAQWALYAAVAAALVSGIASLLVQLIKVLAER